MFQELLDTCRHVTGHPYPPPTDSPTHPCVGLLGYTGREIANRHGVDIAHVAMRWVLDQQQV